MSEFDISRDLEVEALRQALYKSNKQLAQAKNKVDQMAQAVWDATNSALLALPKHKPIKPPAFTGTSNGKEENAFWHLTDWQGAKVTTSYNSAIMRRRVEQFQVKAAKITNIQRADHPVKRVTVAYGGDMGEGLFNYPTQPFEIDETLFDQFVHIAQLIADNLFFAATVYEDVDVEPEWGNHGRIGDKRAAVPKNNNFDRMIYRMAKQMTIAEPRIHWPADDAFCVEDIQRIEIGNYRALLIHGDEIGRNGFSSPTTIVAHANRWRSGAYRWDFRDVYMGHYHTHAEWPMANGEGAVYQTGSTESDNRYARDSMASSAIPSQRLHFIDPDRGRVSAQYKIVLD